MPIFHFYFTVETIFASGFWTKPFPSHTLPNYHLLFTSGILVIYTHWDMYMPFSFHPGRLWMALENIPARGRKQWTVTKEEYTEKSWDVRVSFVPLMSLSILIIIIWIIGVPPNNGKIPGIFFHEEFCSDIVEKMCNGQSSLHRASATVVKAIGNCNAASWLSWYRHISLRCLPAAFWLNMKNLCRLHLMLEVYFKNPHGHYTCLTNF